MGSSSKTTQTTTATATSSPTEEALSSYKSALAKAGQLSDAEWNPKTASSVAQLTGQQLEAIGKASDAQGVYQPYLDTASEYTKGAASAITADEIANYLNPYLSSVAESTMANLAESQKAERADIVGNAISQGALGGGMVKGAQSELARKQGLVNSQTLADIFSGGYNTALSAAQSDKARQLSAGSQMASLGSAAQSMGISDIELLYNAGKTLQEQEQAALDTATANAQAETLWPYQTTSWLSDISKSLGPLMGSTTESESYTSGKTKTSDTSSKIGAGISALSMLAAFSDERVKEGVTPVGKTFDGQTIYKFRYKGSPKTHIGMIAQEVEKIHPEAVGSIDGIKTVNYDVATEDSERRIHRSDGGSVVAARIPGSTSVFGSLPEVRNQRMSLPNLESSTSTSWPSTGTTGSSSSGTTSGSSTDWAALSKQASDSLSSIINQISGTSSTGTTAASSSAASSGSSSGIGSWLSGLFGAADGGEVPTVEPAWWEKMLYNVQNPEERRMIWEKWASQHDKTNQSPTTNESVQVAPGEYKEPEPSWKAQIYPTPSGLAGKTIGDLLSTQQVARDRKRDIGVMPPEQTVPVAQEPQTIGGLRDLKQERQGSVGQAPTDQATATQQFPNITAAGGFESGTPDRVKSLSNYSPDRGGSRSIGAYGLNTLPGNSAWTWRNEFGRSLGVTANPGTSEFKAQWDAVAKENPSALIQSEDAWYDRHVAGPTMRGLKSVGLPDSVANDSRVQAFAADRVDQYGAPLAFGRRHSARWNAALEESQGDVPKLIAAMSRYDKEGIGTDFNTYLKENPKHIPGLMNRIDRRMLASLQGSGQGAVETRYAAAPSAGGRVQPQVLGGMAARVPQDQSGTVPQATDQSQELINRLIKSAGSRREPEKSIMERLFGVNILNPLGLNEDQRNAMLTAGLSMMASKNVGQGGLAGLQALRSSQSAREQDEINRIKLAMQIQQLQNQNKRFTTIGSDQYGNPRYGFVDITTGSVTPATIPQSDENAQARQAQSTLTGDDYLSTLDQNSANQVKALAEGRMAFPSGFALKSPYWQQMIRSVSQYDPSFDAVNFRSRAKTRQDFTSGKSAQNITSFNTAIAHLDNLSSAVDDLQNTRFPAWNRIKNITKEQYNTDTQTALKKFETAKIAVTDELTRAFRGSGGNVHDITEWEKTLNSADSPQALKSAIGQAIELLRGRIDSVGDQYNRGMGTTKDPIALLSSKAQAAIDRLGGGIGVRKSGVSRAEAARSGGSSGGPATGDVVGGYRYIGGDPKNAQSWQAVQ